MNINSFIIERLFRQLQLPESTIDQFKIVNSLSDVAEKGFPKELFQLSAPLIVRGLLNFSILQMKRNWVFPFWVHRQLDPLSPSFIPRSQNPLLINITHRNWTMIGTPKGKHEAIVDPRGLLTPLPREWSIDVWLVTEQGVMFPSLSDNVEQQTVASDPCLTTIFKFDGLELKIECFVGETNHGIDVVFSNIVVRNLNSKQSSGYICIAVRPFNPEGVAPINTVAFKSTRLLEIDDVVGVVFAKAPDWRRCSNDSHGDIADAIRKKGTGIFKNREVISSECKQGLAHAVAAYRFSLSQGEKMNSHFSVALSERDKLRNRSIKKTWKVSFEKRRNNATLTWKKEIEAGAIFLFADERLQNIFGTSKDSLLMLHDGNFISPGPYLYHHFWYRDSAVMIRALDILGYHERTRTIIDNFPKRLTSDGFFKGPDGEWDSNGTVLWSVEQHYLLTRSLAWLKHWYATAKSATRWIIKMRESTSNKLMPPSLSAEHLGTVDQYYWDTFWSFRGIISMQGIISIVGNEKEIRDLIEEKNEFLKDILLSFRNNELQLITATPNRCFDESSIGSICAIYPLQLGGEIGNYAANTVDALSSNFVRDDGFYHPFIHSGYNPYLTLQLAHAQLLMGNVAKAWEVADTIFSKMKPPYSLPEAIHPRTKGGSMGDGHHGWAAAEIILFIRDCLVREIDDELHLFQGANGRLVQKEKNILLKNVPTSFGKMTCELTFDGENRGMLKFDNSFFEGQEPKSLIIYLPFNLLKAVAASPENILDIKYQDNQTILSCTPKIQSVLLIF